MTITTKQLPLFVFAAVLVAWSAAQILPAAPVSQAGTSPSAAATTIAYFDLESIFERSARKIATEENLKKYIDQTKEELKALGDKIDSIRTRTTLMKKNGDEYKKALEEMAHIETTMKLKQQEAEGNVEGQWAEFRRQHLAEIRDKVSGYAEAHGLDLVLNRRLPKQPGVPDWDIVFYARPGFDITEPLLALVNGNN